MQFQVPQFIEVEDKILGPFTFKQFVYVAGGAGIAFVAWETLPVYLAGIVIVVAGGLAGALAFIKYNSRPFIIALETAFYYLVAKKLYLWNTEAKKKDKKKKGEEPEQQAEVHIPKLADSKLHELAWSLDIKERIDGAQYRDVPTTASSVVAPNTPPDPDQFRL